MARLRVLADCGPIDGLYLFSIQQSSWFWGWATIAWIWAATKEEALEKGYLEVT